MNFIKFEKSWHIYSFFFDWVQVLILYYFRVTFPLLNFNLLVFGGGVQAGEVIYFPDKKSTMSFVILYIRNQDLLLESLIHFRYCLFDINK